MVPGINIDNKLKLSHGLYTNVNQQICISKFQTLLL